MCLKALDGCIVKTGGVHFCVGPQTTTAPTIFVVKTVCSSNSTEPFQVGESYLPINMVGTLTGLKEIVG